MSLYKFYGYKKVSPSTYGYSESIYRQQRRRLIFGGVLMLIIALIGIAILTVHIIATTPVPQ